MQRLIRVLYPSQCIMCDAATETDFALCGGCWSQTPFVTGLACDGCGVPLPGSPEEAPVLCDGCLATDRPWDRGRAALVYDGIGRKVVLAIKHGDRTDLAPPAARWMAAAARDLVRDDTVIVPVPLHWTRLFVRRFNQAALLARFLGRTLDREVVPDLLVRSVRTTSLGGKTRAGRFETLTGAIRPRHGAGLNGRPVLLVDDVMTSGATLAAAAEAARDAGAGPIDILTLARAAKDT